MYNKKTITISDLLLHNRAIYQIPDDRLYSVEDLIYNNQKFYFEFLKETKAKEKMILLNISLAWFLAIINRYHIHLEKELWKKYCYKCPYCLNIPCVCQKESVGARLKTGRPPKIQPADVDEWQLMMKKIYVNDTSKNIGAKMADVLEKMNQSFRVYIREKKKSQFVELEQNVIDYFALFIRTFNCYGKLISDDFEVFFRDGCYVCKKIPCECSYYE